MVARRVSRSISLRLVLVVPFIVQIVAAVSLVGYLSYRNGQKAVANLAAQLGGEVAQRVEEQLTTYLSQPQLVNQLNLDAIGLGNLDISDPDALRKHFWKQLQRFDGLALISFVSAENEMFMVSRFENRLQADLVLRSRPNTIQTFALDKRGELGELRDIVPDFDPQNTPPGYRNALEAGQAVWNPIFALTGLPYLAISASAPAIAPDGEVQGVVFADLTFDFLDRYLRQLKVGKSGQIFIVERTGNLVASSVLEQTFALDEAGKAQRIRADRTTDSTLNAAIRYIEQELGGLATLQATRQTTLKIDGQRYFLQPIPFRDEYGLDWITGVLIRESDFIAEIQANNRRTIVLCLAALAIATALGFLTSRRIAEPLWQLSQSAEAVSQGHLEQQIPAAPIAELNTLASAFNRMAAQLKTAFADLEQKVTERTAELSSTLHQLKQTQAQLIHTEKMSSLGQLVAGVAHEINNPISFISGNIEHARDYIQQLLALLAAYERHLPDPPPDIAQLSEAMDLDFLREDLLESLSSMESGTERVCKIVASLRGFVRLDESDLKRIDLHEGIDNTLEILGSRLESSGIQIVRCYDQLAPVECYASQLNQVFLNIIANAIDAFDDEVSRPPNAAPYLEVRTQQLSSDWVRIEIADNGPGIPETVRAKIFDAFFTTKMVGKGTGLGLYISYHIVVEQHGGRLLCKSDGDRGTTFAIELPTQQSDRPAQNRTSSDQVAKL